MRRNKTIKFASNDNKSQIIPNQQSSRNKHPAPIERILSVLLNYRRECCSINLSANWIYELTPNRLLCFVRALIGGPPRRQSIGIQMFNRCAHVEEVRSRTIEKKYEHSKFIIKYKIQIIIIIAVVVAVTSANGWVTCGFCAIIFIRTVLYAAFYSLKIKWISHAQPCAAFLLLFIDKNATCVRLALTRVPNEFFFISTLFTFV